MKKSTLPFFYATGAIMMFLASSCSYDFPDVPSEDLSPPVGVNNVMIIGGSWLSGTKDGVLDRQSIETAPGNILMSRLFGIETSEFGLSISEGSGENLYNGTGAKGQSYLAYESEDRVYPVKNYESDGTSLSYQMQSDINTMGNFSLPGFRVFHLSDFSVQPPAVNPANFNLASHIDNIKPDLVILELGIEEILPFARAGGEGNPNVTDLADLTSQDMISIDLFESHLRDIIDRIKTNNSQAKVLLINTPDVTKFAEFYEMVNFNVPPYFTSDQQIDDAFQFGNGYPFGYNRVILQYYNQNNTQLSDREYVWLPEDDVPDTAEWSWRYIIEDTNLPLVEDFDYEYQQNGMTMTESVTLPQIREVARSERVLFGIETEIFENQLGFPGSQIPEEFILDENEISEIQSKTSSFNNIMLSLTSEYEGVKIMNLRDTFSEFFEGEYRGFRIAVPADGILIDNVPMRPGFLVNGFFSTDGINPNARGSAFLTNSIIESLNQSFNYSIKTVSPNQYAGNKIVKAF